MKQLKNIAFVLIFSLISNICFSQLNPVKKFDMSILKDKVLYIPAYDVSQKYTARMSKRGKFDKLADKKAQIEAYNKAWKEAMAESSYDATDYEIRGFEYKKMFKSKDPKAILLYYIIDKYGNEYAKLIATGPKKKVIAQTMITGLDLSNKNDIRLMMNMLNESMTTAAEIQSEGNKASFKNIGKKYKIALVEWAEDMKSKTFLVPKSEHKNKKKADNRNADLKEALKNWKISNYEFTTEEEVNNKRIEGDEGSYYWKTFRIYTSSPLITLNYNIILSADSDDMIVGFMGKKRLKPATLDLIQKKILAKVEKYKKQLAK